MRKLAFKFIKFDIEAKQVGRLDLPDQRKSQHSVSRTAPPPPTQPQHIELQA